MRNGAFAKNARVAQVSILLMAATMTAGRAINPMVAGTSPQESAAPASRELPSSYPLDTMEGARAHAQGYQRAPHQ